MNRLSILILIVCAPFSIYCQEPDESMIFSQIIEELAAEASDPEEAALYTGKLQELADEPVNLNSSDQDEISRLFFLSDFQVKSIMDYTRTTGRILTIYEVAAIPGFDRELATMMSPFITLEDNSAMSSYKGRWKNDIITSLSYRSGDKDTSAPGSPLRSLSKYKFIAGSLSGGLTIEKDAGETFISGNTIVPDFFSANICYTGKGIIRKIIAGDFSARAGQGTNLNTGIRTGMSLVSSGFMAAKNEIKPYTSTDENNFFRGTAMNARFKNISASLFLSLNSIDATTATSEETGEDQILSLYKSGLHNTQSSLQKKDAVKITTWGINLRYDFRNMMIGLSTVSDRLSLRMEGQGNSPDNLFDFEGNHNSVYTAFYNSTVKRLLLFGEISFNENGRHALVQGLTAKPAGRLTINFLYRNYSPGYTSFHGKGPGAGSGTANEEGILGNFIFEAASHLFITGGCDISWFPWLKYRCSAPSYGVRKELLARYSPSDRLTIEALYNYRYSMIDSPGTPGIVLQAPFLSKSIKGTFKYSLTENVTFMTRIEHKTVDNSNDTGILFLQDLKLDMKEIPLTLWMRYCIFRTGSYNTRIYTYENDLLYGFSIPALSGSGSRSYIMLRWKAGKTLELRLKYGITSIQANTGISSNREDIKMQVRLRF